MRRRRFQILLAAGTLCLAAALCLAGYNIWDEQRATVSASEAVEVLVREIPDRPEKEQPLAPEPQPMMTSVELDERYYVGLLEIPDLELTLPIQREWSDALLHYSPCVYQGTLADGLIIAGHNYRSHFAHLNQLAAGAEVRFRAGRQRVDLYRGRVGNYRRERRGVYGGGGLGFDPVHLHLRGAGAVYPAVLPEPCLKHIKKAACQFQQIDTPLF